MNFGIPNWTIRFIYLYQRRYDEFLDYKKTYDLKVQNNTVEFDDKVQYCEVFKKLFEACWKLLKYRLKDSNIYKFLPREIILEAEKMGFIEGSEILLEFIFDFNDITDIPFYENGIGDKFIEKIEILYFPFISKFKELWIKNLNDIYDENKAIYKKYFFTSKYVMQKEAMENAS